VRSISRERFFPTGSEATSQILTRRENFRAPFCAIPGLKGGTETESVIKEVGMERSGKGSRLVGRALVAGALALVLGGLLVLSAEARGRGWEGRAPSPDRQAARMAERLGLSTEQKAQVQAILTEGHAKRTEILEEGRRKMESLRGETEKRFSSVLTPEQMTELKRFREERRERRRDCGPCRDDRGGGFPEGALPRD
jgi:Spy/CpxP family protein refolding chaperone